MDFSPKNNIFGKLVLLEKHRFFTIMFILTIISLLVFLGKAEGDDAKTAKTSIETPISSSESKTITASIEHYNFADQFQFEEEGKSSWYGKKFQNRKTASGERFDMYSYTAAHRTLPFGTIVRIINSETSKTILVKINDRGPFIKDRIIDLSYFSANEISLSGTPQVKIEGLMYHDNSLLKYTDEEFYFGYSLDLPLVCLPGSVLKIEQMTDDFNEAVQLYNEAHKKNPHRLVYLLTPAKNYSQDDVSNLPEVYYISFFEPQNQNRNKFAFNTGK